MLDGLFQPLSRKAVTMKTVVAVLLLTVTVNLYGGIDTILARSGNRLYGQCLESERSLDGAEPVDEGSAMFCMGYVGGMADILAQWQLSDKGYKDRKMAACINSKVTGGELVRVVMKYMRDNPAKLHLDRSEIVITALHDGFPCK
jgi:hypothetical protein